MQQKRHGQWVKVSRHKAAVAKAGKTLALRAVLTNSTGSTTVPLSFDIPKKAARPARFDGRHRRSLGLVVRR